MLPLSHRFTPSASEAPLLSTTASSVSSFSSGTSSASSLSSGTLFFLCLVSRRRAVGTFGGIAYSRVVFLIFVACSAKAIQSSFHQEPKGQPIKAINFGTPCM